MCHQCDVKYNGIVMTMYNDYKQVCYITMWLVTKHAFYPSVWVDQRKKQGYYIVVTWARVACLIYTPEGRRPEG